MLEVLERAEKIYARIKIGNHSLCFYYHYAQELDCLIDNLKSDVYND